MTYDARRRDRYRLVVAAVTGLAACAVAGTTGAVTGKVEADAARDAAEKASAPIPSSTRAPAVQRKPKPRVVTKERPVRTRVVTRVVRVTVGGDEVAAPTTTSPSTPSTPSTPSNPGPAHNPGPGNSGPGNGGNSGPSQPQPDPPPSQSSGS